MLYIDDRTILCENRHTRSPHEKTLLLYSDLMRIPAKIHKVKNLTLLLETAVELARRKSVARHHCSTGVSKQITVSAPCLTNMVKPALAMTLSVMDGYYLGNTCLTLEMAYLNARMIARPTAGWLTDLVK